MPQLSLGNLLAWMEQAFLLASAGSLLLMIFRIRHPRTKLAYCHSLLVICLLLPLQPWKHPVIERASAGNSLANSAFQMATPIVWLLLAGVAIKLCWLLGGLWRIRRNRIASMPLYPIPESVRAAWAVTHADALFCISSDVPGPVMLGWLTPVVLLPESFLTLGEEAQCAIACHELLHVRRHDWLITVLEELAGTLFWFNPAIWPLLAETRLAREQLVDAEVVRLTAAREPYIDALLAIARGGMALDLAPAPLFLRRRHLTQRVHLLLKDVRTSPSQILSSYAFITAILALAGWFGFTVFPLIGQPVYRDAPPPMVSAPPPAATCSWRRCYPSQLRRQWQRKVPRYLTGQATRYVPTAPVPPDPQEPILNGPVRALTDPSERAAALALLKRARNNARLRLPSTPAYRFDASFTAGGNAMNTGAGHLTWIRLSGQRERWSAVLNGFSIVQMISSGEVLEGAHALIIPIRVQSLREAIFWAAREIGSDTQVRSAAIEWNGRPATCLLLSRWDSEASLPQARLWEEDEYCIDDGSGLLQMYSIAPGTYTVYGYGRSLYFHGETLADRVTIYTGGAVAADADFNIVDAGPIEESLLIPGGSANDAKVTLGTTLRFPIRTPNPFPAKVVEPVIVHAEIDAEGKVLEEELSAAADPALIQAALDLVKRGPFRKMGSTQWQAYINVRFKPQSGN